MGTERDNATRRNTKKRGGVRVDEKRGKGKRERERRGGGEKRVPFEMDITTVNVTPTASTLSRITVREIYL